MTFRLKDFVKRPVDLVYGVDALDVRPRYEVYCLLCARGLGQYGELVDTDNLPTRIWPCHHCGGSLLVRRVDDSGVERMMRQRELAA